MRRFQSAALAVAIGVGSLAVGTSSASAAVIYGVTPGNTLFSFNSDMPTALLSGTPISNLAANEVVRGIDVRPATGALYAVGSFGNIYTLNGLTGAATKISTISGASLNGVNFGVDFNPVPNLLRITSDAGQNLRVNVDTGVATVDGPLSSLNVFGSGYTNSEVGLPAPASTTLYDLLSGSDQLATQAPPNVGTINPVGPLGVDVGSVGGLDILTEGANNTLFAALTPVGSSATSFYTINTISGTATLVGTIGGGFLVNDIAVVQNPSLILPEPATLGGLAIGAIGLIRRRQAL